MQPGGGRVQRVQRVRRVRRVRPEFAQFAIIAKASEHEVLNHFIDAHQRRYITDMELDLGDHAVRRALKVLNGLIAYLESTPNWGRD